jgi:hypothetical protein
MGMEFFWAVISFQTAGRLAFGQDAETKRPRQNERRRILVSSQAYILVLSSLLLF